jgi:hypothetical protein
MKKINSYYKTKNQRIEELEDKILRLEDQSEIKYLKERNLELEYMIEELKGELKGKEHEIDLLKKQEDQYKRKLKLESEKFKSSEDINLRENVQLKKEIKSLEIKVTELTKINNKLNCDYQVIHEIFIEKMPEYIFNELSPDKDNTIKPDEYFGFRKEEDKWYFPDYDSKDEKIKDQLKDQIEMNRISKINKVLCTYFENKFEHRIFLHDVRLIMNFFFEEDNIPTLNKSGKDIDLLMQCLSEYELKRNNRGNVLIGLKFKYQYEISKVKNIKLKRYTN